jgi:hypothetical protein
LDDTTHLSRRISPLESPIRVSVHESTSHFTQPQPSFIFYISDWSACNYSVCAPPAVYAVRSRLATGTWCCKTRQNHSYASHDWTHLNSHNSENNSDCDSTRCSANEHIVISSVVGAGDSPDDEVAFVDDSAHGGSAPSATSLNERAEQLCMPVRVWKASAVYLKR